MSVTNIMCGCVCNSMCFTENIKEKSVLKFQATKNQEESEVIWSVKLLASAVALSMWWLLQCFVSGKKLCPVRKRTWKLKQNGLPRGLASGCHNNDLTCLSSAHPRPLTLAWGILTLSKLWVLWIVPVNKYLFCFLFYRIKKCSLASRMTLYHSGSLGFHS